MRRRRSFCKLRDLLVGLRQCLGNGDTIERDREGVGSVPTLQFRDSGRGPSLEAISKCLSRCT